MRQEKLFQKSRVRAFVLVFAAAGLVSCQNQEQPFRLSQGVLIHDQDQAQDQGPTSGVELDQPDLPDAYDDVHDGEHQLADTEAPDFVVPFACTKATKAQIASINRGNELYDSFMRGCWAATNNSRWCEQLTRPNPASRATFICTYGTDQPHRLIHPDTATWTNAFKSVQLIQELEAKGISTYQIYNWWRPQPYNGNVGGAAGRHPYGTSVDVRFTSKKDMERAHSQLCKWRSQGRLRALGYYGSTALHFGVGDATANTWGKGCGS